MQIYYLDDNLTLNAQYHAQAHVGKLILEAAQVLCAVNWDWVGWAPYKPTHKSHPLVFWAQRSVANWIWLQDYALALNEEWRWRGGHKVNHKSADVVRNLKIPHLPDKPRSDIFQGVGKKYQIPGNPVEAFRNYFCGERLYLAAWGRRGPPQWFLDRGFTAEHIEKAKMEHEMKNKEKRRA